ncbi:MAG: RidA family protein [Ignisphaera sp.]|uniref:RidA family protein n=1 Tax=Ignisphaera aggregans TaxID=334771 RepID=A0A7J3I685_9CREN
MKRVVFTDNAPRPVGPYSQAVCIDGWLFISGQLPLDPKSNNIVEGDFKTKVRRALENVKAIVESVGGSLDNIVKVTVYISDISRFAEFNEVYREFFPQTPPARSVIGVAKLPRDAEVEVEAIARIGRC